MYEIDVATFIGSLVGIVALYHLFGCGNPLSLFDPGSATGTQSEQAGQVLDQTIAMDQYAQGQDKTAQVKAQDDIAPVIDYLQQQGMDADHAQVIQQAVANASQQDLSQVYQQLKGLADNVQQGLIKPGDLSTVGGIIATAVQKQYQTGQAFDFGKTMSDITQQMKTQMPQLQATAGQAAGAADKITAQTGALGKLDQGQFNERMAPALQQINQQYQNDSRTLNEQMDARGVQEQGSFAGTGTDAEGNFKVNPKISSESTPVNQARLMLAQQHDKDLNSATLQAQAQAEGQQVNELTAAQQTPGALGTAVETQASPFAALSNQTAAEGNTNLALQSSRAADTTSLANTGANAATTKVAGQTGSTQAQQDVLANQTARRDQTLPTAIEQKATPQSSRLAIGAGVTPGVTGALSSLGSSAIDAQTSKQIAGGKAFSGGITGALAALA